MSSRQRAVAVIGSVHVCAPTARSRYYRLIWTEPDGRRVTTSGGVTVEDAQAKARSVAERLRLAVGPKSLTPLGEIVDAYVASPKGRSHTREGGDWTDSHLLQITHALRRSTRLMETVPALEVDRALIDTMRAQGGTSNVVDANTSALRGLLRWGHAERYFTAAQAEMLPARPAPVAPAILGTRAPRRRGKGRHVTESADYIRPEDAPSASQVAQAGNELAKHFPWGKLAVELAASGGLRWGEQFQLTAHDVVTSDGGHLMLRIHHQIDSSARTTRGDDRRKLPKGEKTRETGLSRTTLTRYPLRKEMLRRRDIALREQAEGINPEALLFPASEGGMHHHSAFMSKHFRPAAMAAGWPYQEWEEVHEVWDEPTRTYVARTRARIQLSLTWHSFRHRFAREAIDRLNLTAGELMAIGGWESEEVVRGRYYNVGKEHRDSALAKFG